MRRARIVMRTVATVSLLGAAACPQKKTAGVAPKRLTIPDSAETIAFGTRVVLTDRGVNKGELLSDTALTYEDGTRLVLYPVNLTFYTSTGAKDGVMTAKWGTYNQRLQRLEVRGNVVVVREDGKRLSTPQLVYDQQRNQFFTDSAFTLNEPKRTGTGIGFESDPKLTNFKCLKSCKFTGAVQVPTK
jgi:LPS export ABC transporter protein LptC